MSVNLVDIFIMAVIGLCVFTGMYKGFIASGLSALGFVAAWFGAWFLFPYLSQALQSNESLMGALGYYLNANELFKSHDLASALVSQAQQDGLLTSVLADINLPALIENAFQTNVAGQQFMGLGLTTMSQYLDRTIWQTIINVVSFVIMFAVSYCAVVLVVNLINAIFRFPLLRHMDWLLGGVFGLARGAVVVMLILAILPLLTAVVQLDAVNAMIEQSQFAHYFQYDALISDVAKKIFA